MIKFDDVKEVSIEGLNGGKGITKANMFMDENIKIMRSTLGVGCSIGKHKHETSSEVMYVISGVAKCTLNDTIEIINAGECHYCPKGFYHSIENFGDEDLIMIDIVPEQ